MTDRLDIITAPLLRRINGSYGYGVTVRKLDSADRAALRSLVAAGLVETREEDHEVRAFAVSK